MVMVATVKVVMLVVVTIMLVLVMIIVSRMPMSDDLIYNVWIF